MELFYSRDIEGGICRLDHDESGHCIKVLRHRCGDEISVIDGCGTLYRCRIVSDSHKEVTAAVIDSVKDWGSHPYRLHMAVCPTKNNDRYEWFAEKATEIGFDELSFLNCANSERRVVKCERVNKILIAGMKQSHKAWKPVLNEMTDFKKFIESPREGQKFICHCHASEDIGEEPASVRPFLLDILQKGEPATVLIGPEGDFSIDEVKFALTKGYQSVSLGKSRLRTETAALVAVHCMQIKNQI